MLGLLFDPEDKVSKFLLQTGELLAELAASLSEKSACERVRFHTTVS
jgi:hypothetical protein